MSWGLVSLSVTDISDLESYLGLPLSSLSTSSSTNTKAELIMDILESLWVTHALKERDFDAWFNELKQLHAQEV